MVVSELCANLNYTNFGTVGQCLVETTLFGDVALAGLIVFILFVGLVIRYNFPIQLILPIGIALAYVLWLMTLADIFLGILMLGLIIGGAILIIALLSYLDR